MSNRQPVKWPAWIAPLAVLVACGGTEEPSGPKGSGGSAGQVGDAGGAAGSAGLGGSNAGAPQGGAPAGGGGTGSGQMCGVEICSGTRQCCPSTGKCYDPSFEGCGKITCTITSNDTGGGAGAANCCPMNLSHCASNNLCYHSACVGCCP